MNCTFYIFFFIFVVDCLALSNDSLQKGRVFPEIIKESNKATVKGKMYIPITVVTDSTILQNRPQQVDELLSQIPGLFINNYGGLGGMKSVSMRGTSSSQSIIMIEGIRMNASQSGMIDLSTIPSNFLKSIEVTRTGASALYGANSIGGAINFRLLQGQKQKPTITLERSSFETYSTSASTGFSFNDIVTNISFNTISSRGNFPFSHNEFGSNSIKQRENGDFRQYSGFLSTTFSPSVTSSYSLMYMTSFTERGVPGAVVQGSLEFKNARLQETNNFISINADNSITSSVYNNSKVWFRKNSFLYEDPDATLMGANGISAKYLATDVGFQNTLTVSFDNNSYIESQIEAISQLVNGFSLEDGETITPHRKVVSFSSHYSSPLFNFYSIPVQFLAGVRYDYISDQKDALSPLFAFTVPLFTDFKFRTSYSYNYRAPSFNEMYYLNYGNQNLLSELSHSLTVGFDAAVSQQIVVSIDLFSLQTSNLIVSIPTSPASWSAQNIGLSESRGIELTSKLSLFTDRIALVANTTFQNVVDKTENSLTYNLRIPYTPSIVTSVQLVSTLNDFTSGITYSSSGNRYSLQGHQASSLLPFFHTVSTFVEYKKALFPLLLHARIQADNLLDYSYSVIRNFPIPGRSFRLNIGATWL